MKFTLVVNIGNKEAEANCQLLKQIIVDILKIAGIIDYDWKMETSETP